MDIATFAASYPSARFFLLSDYNNLYVYMAPGVYYQLLFKDHVSGARLMMMNTVDYPYINGDRIVEIRVKPKQQQTKIAVIIPNSGYLFT